MLGNGIHDVFLRCVAELDDGVLKFGACLLLKSLRFGDLIGSKDALFDKDIGEVATGLAHR